MTKYPRHFRCRIRNKTDTADLLVLTSMIGGTNPYITAPPDGDGESFDPLTGAPTSGSYTVRVADPLTATNTRPVTSVLADVYARQQMIGVKAFVEQSENNGATWVSLIVGYVMGVRLVSAIEYEFSIGQSRRIEASRTVFKEATTEFPAVTSVIGGPVLGGFINDDFLKDYGGWEFEVDENTATHVKLRLTTGFDPRKSPSSTFSSTSTAIADFTNWWARPFFRPSSIWAASNIRGNFPGLRARLTPVGGGTTVILVPLARPATAGGPWWNPSEEADRLTGFGTSQLYLPKFDINGAAFSPSIGTDYKVYVYATAISKDNPLHYYGHPVDLWEKLRIDAGIPYDTTVLPALKSLIGSGIKLALRITESSKLGDFDQKVIYGPFRLSSRIEDGKRVLFRTSVVDNADPPETIARASLRDDSGTVFDLDEGSAITTLTLKSQTIIKWSTEESDQPEVDGLLSRDAYPQSIENSDDDIPAGTEREVIVGDIPGMIWDDLGPVSLESRLTELASEMFDRFGRGAIQVELDCLPDIDAKLGEEVLLDLPHLPGAQVGLTPVSQRNVGPTPFQITQKTEQPEGPKLTLVNSLPTANAGTLPTFTLVPSSLDNLRYGKVTITNATALNAAKLDVRVEYAVSSTVPTAGNHFTTVLWESMTGATYDVEVGPVEAIGSLWVRLRSESPSTRPSAYTAWKAISILRGTVRLNSRLRGQLTVTP